MSTDAKYLGVFAVLLMMLREQPWKRTTDSMAWGRQVHVGNRNDITTQQITALQAMAQQKGCFIDTAGYLDVEYDDNELYLIETAAPEEDMRPLVEVYAPHAGHELSVELSVIVGEQFVYVNCNTCDEQVAQYHKDSKRCL